MHKSVSREFHIVQNGMLLLFFNIIKTGSRRYLSSHGINRNLSSIIPLGVTEQGLMENNVVSHGHEVLEKAEIHK